MLLSAVLVAGLAAGADSTLLRVLAINDFHGALEPRVYGWSKGRPVGGAAALAATLDSAALRCHCPVLRLDGGDEMQGSLASNLVYGRSSIEAMNAFRLDAAVVGNHELDWGVDTLKARMREARYSWVAANVFDSVTGKRPSWAVPYRMVSRGGLRIAVVGYMAARTKEMVSAKAVAGLIWRKGPASIADAMAAVRAERPDLTILVAHEGAFCDSLPCNGEIVDLARGLDSTQVQLIISGHTHSLVNTVVNGIPIVQARSNGRAYDLVDLVRHDDGRRSWRSSVEDVWADAVTPDSSVETMLNRYRPMVARLSTRKVAVLRDSLIKRGPQFPLGNLIADAQRAALPGIDFAITNNGGIRRDLYPGPLTYGDLFELQPFFNNITRVWMTGRQLRDLLEFALLTGEPRFHISGLVVRYDPRKFPRERVLSVRRSNGGSVDPKRTYVVAMSDFLQGGAEGLTMLTSLRSRRTGKTDLDALIAYARRLPQPIVAPRGLRFIPVTP